MRRWTDGRTWSPSRVSGSFLTYRELESKRRGANASRSSVSNGSIDGSSDTDSSDSYGNGGTGVPAESSKTSFSYKPDGLVKQSFSICTGAQQKLHLICYYTKQDVLNNRLNTPSQDEKFKGIIIPKGMYPDTNSLEPSGGATNAMHNSAPYNKNSNGRYHQKIHPYHSHNYNRGSPYALPSSPSTRRSNRMRRPSVDNLMNPMIVPKSTAIDIPYPSQMHSPSLPPSLSSSPSPMSSDDELPNTPNFYRDSTPSRTILPRKPTDISPTYSRSRSVMLVSPMPSYEINIPALEFSSNISGHIPAQDIPWEKFPWSEDERQLNAIHATLRL